MTELRDYQQDLLAQVQASLTEPSARVMLQLPTGGGKTQIAGELLSDWLQNGRKAVWLTHRRELASQTEGMLHESGVPATANIRWEPHTNAPAITNGVVILMAQTVSRRNARADVWHQYNTNDLMIIDEAHHATADGWARAIRQWPGPVIGMTATPWRLSIQEGFDHLFGELHCGPQVADLQSENWLCRARVLSPPEEEQIRGGQVDYTGDYSEAGIETANQERDEILTAGALRFWQKHGYNRQTIIYAVSVIHARNLFNVFYDAGVPAEVLLGDTPNTARARLIERFQNGNIKVLINVAVVTEGFDLPEASCVVLTRPTMSLSLYLQMVGRGLRPKQDDGDCVVLDLAGNSLRHGLPDAEQKWSLAPRGQQDEDGGPILVRCADCAALSPAASHYCDYCGAPFGETCDRCGRWRAWESWSLRDKCLEQHDPVCDRCHYDAHIQAQLPITEELQGLADMQDYEAAVELSPDRDPFLKHFLEDELKRLSGATESRKAELRRLIETRASGLADDNVISGLFESHIVTLPTDVRPQTFPQKSRLYIEWEGNLRRELAQWRNELATLESQRIDGQQVFDGAKERLLQLFEAEAKEAGLLPYQQTVEQLTSPVSPDAGEWMTFPQLREWGRNLMRQEKKGTSIKPLRMRDSKGTEIPVRNWANLLSETAEWLIREGLLTENDCPVTVVGERSRYLIHEMPIHGDKKEFKSIRNLSNGLYLECHLGSNAIAQRCAPLVEHFGQDPAQFHVWLG